MKKVMFIGAVGSGKTSLCQNIKGEEVSYDKTQSVEYHSNLVDTPGEFVQHRRYYSVLQTLSVDAGVIALVASVLSDYQVFVPKFSSNFNADCIGIITKMDLDYENENLKYVRQQLQLAGAKRIFEVSALTDFGMSELLEFLS